MYFDTSANKMKVYNGTTNAWDDVASVGNFYINTLSSSSNTGGGSATFNDNAYRFQLSNAPTMAQQLIVSVNGVIQKPNAGSSQPSEGFAIDGNDIIFAAAPAANSDYFIVTQGSSVSIGTPSDNTVSTAKIQNLGVTTAKIAADAVTSAKIADGAIENSHLASQSVGQGNLMGEAVNESKIQISNDGTNGQFLQKQSGNNGGLTWADGASEGTDVKSTGESGTTKFLRTDGDGTCSWQVPPSYTHPNHSGEVTSSADGAQTIASNVVDEDNLKVSNSPTNGQFLQAQSGNTGGLTWADVSAAPEITATVDGSLSANDAVIVKSTGNIEKVTKTITLADPITHSSIRQISNNRYDHKLAYDKLTGYVACVCRNGNLNNRGQLTFHKLDDSSYQPTAESGGNIYTVNNSDFYFPAIAGNGKGQFLIAYKDTGDQRIVCAAWSVNSSGVGTQHDKKYVSDNGQSCNYVGVVYSPDDDLFVLVYRQGSVTKSRTVSMTSGGSTTLNTVSSDVLSYSLNSPNIYLYYDEYSNKVIHSGWNSSYVRAVSGTISGTNLSWNSAVNIAGNGSYQGEYYTLGGDPKTGLMFACWMGASSQSDYGKAIGFKVNGNGFTVGSETTHRTSATPAHGVGYNGSTEQIVMSYGGNGSWSTRTVSINSSTLALTFGTAEEIAAHSPQYSPQSVVWMEDQSRMMISSSAPSSQNYQTNLVSAYYGTSSTNMTTTNFIGFSSDAYTNGNTGTVNVVGNTTTKSSLTPGSKYYVQIDGTLATTADNPSVEAGVALSSTKLLIKG